jgi:hypothetical protein
MKYPIGACKMDKMSWMSRDKGGEYWGRNYESDEKEVLLLAWGAHENFYRDLKRYLS